MAGGKSAAAHDALYKALVDAAPDALVVVDSRGIIQIANRQAETLFGYTRDELIGKLVDMLVPDAVRPIHPQHRDRYVSHPQTRPMGAGLKLSARRKDGTTFPVDISLSAIETEGGILVSAAVRDTTERLALEAKFEGLLDSAPDAIVAVDGAGLVRLVNRQAESLFGYDRKELIGQKLERLVPPRIRAKHPALRASYVADPTPRPMGAGLDLSAVRKDGTEFPVDIALSSIETPEGILVSAAVRDITARVEAERERSLIQEELHKARLRQAQRLETVGQLAGGIAHDFNNLLAVILNYADFVGERLPDGEMKQDVEEIRKAATRAADLTRQLLIFARREVSKPELLELNEVVSGVENLLRRTLGEHVEFVKLLSAGLPAVRADPGQLEQVFLNVAVNARDAMPSGGRLLVETSLVDLDDAYADAHPGVVAGSYVRLSVSDTGVGMPPDVVARAFEPFFTTKPAGQGTGLGLATVYGVITQAGGNVRIYSEVGSGTLVAIHLPAVYEQATAAMRQQIAAPAADQGRGETVLIVEDEAAVLLAAIRILSANGYMVLAQSSPPEALALLADLSRRVDVLVTDVVMPEMSGVELARRARKLRPGLKVLYMSGYSSEMVARQGAMDPSSRLLQKPFTRVQLLDAVRQTLGSGKTDA
jgi:PAS domain S-box-containing protein